MPQLGVLFDTQKLGNGFYGYVSFRILFSVLKTSDLAGCTFYHGVVERDGCQAYCIAIESGRVRALMLLRQKVGASVARGLMPVEYRFLEGDDLEDDQLTMVAAISEAGDLINCKSKWLLEVWQRSQAAMRPSPAPVPVRYSAAVAVQQQTAVQPPASIPGRVPFPLWWSHHARRAFGLMVAFCFAGALLQAFGPGVALCAWLAVAGVVQGIAMRWRLWAEQRISGEAALEEVRRLVGVVGADEICQWLQRPGAQSSPLLRTLQSITRHWSVTHDATAMTAILDQHRKADEHMLRADLEELRFCSWGVPALAACSFLAMQVFVGVPESWMEAPRLALSGAVGWLAVEALRSSIRATAERLHGDIARLALASWLPVLERAMPPEPPARPRTIHATA